MTWLISIDNGEDYSGNDHEVVLSCKTEADAIAAKALWDAWFSRVPTIPSQWTKEYRHVDNSWIVANPPPFGPSVSFYFQTTKAACGILEVPEWAENRP